MRYFFALGNNPTLSIAEISAVFGLNEQSGSSVDFFSSGDIIILETEQEIDAYSLIRNLGGTIKIGRIFAETRNDIPLIKRKSLELFDTDSQKGKLKFGISYYGSGKFNTKVLGMEIKNHLKENNISCRWVTSKESVLSSVVVEQNKLLNKGIEIVLIKNKDKILLGQTLAVQAFKELSYRDYGRPQRDDLSGMIPPKLAQIMINLAYPLFPVEKYPDKIFLDPFCGSGTILTEAALMGYQNLIGSDISQKAINDTEANLEWTKKNYRLPELNYKLFVNDVRSLTNDIAADSIDFIATEPYLGPQRGKFDNQIIKELEMLYSQSLQTLFKLLKPGGKVVMIWPAFSHKTGGGSPSDLYFINPSVFKFQTVNPIPKILYNHKTIQISKRNSMVYGRPGQKVWREIIILKK